MEELEGVVDAKTLEGSYLFPATPYDESHVDWYLSSLYGCKFPLLLEDAGFTSEVEIALISSSDKSLEGRTKAEFNLDLVTRLLHTQPCFRLDGSKLDAPETVVKGKYIMACSLRVPASWRSSARDLAVKSNELYANKPLDFEMIIVACLLLNDGWDKYADIPKFFKPFHPSCIVIPLHPDIEDSLNLHALEVSRGLVIDPNYTVLVDSHLATLRDYGSAAFPFTDEVPTLWKEHWDRKPSSLENILGLGPSFEVFRKIPETKPVHLEYRAVSHFKSKIVLLYLFKFGHKLPLLYNTAIGLTDKGMEFEIVTAYVPFPGETFNPLQFPNVFSTVVARLGFSWWVVPYESSMFPRLRYLYDCAEDQVIVFDPKLKEGDPHGVQIMTVYHGEPSMFPFTKMSVVEHIMEELTQVTLQFLLRPINYLYREGDCCKKDSKYKSFLEGKNVLVYIDSCFTHHRTVFPPFNSWCKTLDAEKCDFELLFITLNPFDETHGTLFEDLRLPIPRWLVTPPHELRHSQYVFDEFFAKVFKHEFSTVIAFGKDGKICSMRAQDVVSSSCCKAGTFPFDDCDLPGEVYKILDDYYKQLFDNDDRV